ncbi:MAG: hypothetical protein ACE15E_18105 [Acidobacteriota bacterium]
MTRKLAFLLIDANIIIEAFRLGVWEALAKHCDIYLPEVMLTEALYYFDSTETRHPINLNPYCQSGAVTVVASNSPLPGRSSTASILFIGTRSTTGRRRLSHTSLNRMRAGDSAPPTRSFSESLVTPIALSRDYHSSYF